MQVGTEYIRHVSTVLRSHINSLKAISSHVAFEGNKIIIYHANMVIWNVSDADILSHLHK